MDCCVLEQRQVHSPNLSTHLGPLRLYLSSRNHLTRHLAVFVNEKVFFCMSETLAGQLHQCVVFVRDPSTVQYLQKPQGTVFVSVLLSFR